MFDTARFVETDEPPREEAESELEELRLLVAAESEVELGVPPAFDAVQPPRGLAKVLEFVAPRDPEPDAEFAGPLRPMEDDGPRLAADAAEPLLNPRAEF